MTLSQDLVCCASFAFLLLCHVTFTYVMCRMENVPSNLISDLREKMLLEYKANPSQYDHRDIDRIKDSTTDWHVRRYLIHYDGDLSDAFDGMKANFKWRRRVKMNTMTAASFPCEFFDTGVVHLTKDRQGRALLVVNIAAHGPFGSLRRDWYEFIYWNFDQVDQHVKDNLWGLFSDISRARVVNFDMQGVHLFFPAADRFPAGLTVAAPANAGPVITPVVKMIINMLPARFQAVVKVLDKSDMYKLVKKKDLPDNQGGRQLQQRVIPIVEGGSKGCVPISRMASKKGWSQDDVDSFLDFQKEGINEVRRKHGMRPMQ